MFHRKKHRPKSMRRQRSREMQAVADKGFRKHPHLTMAVWRDPR